MEETRAMWFRKDLKKDARAMLKHNYWRMVALCLLVALFAGEANQMLSLVRAYVGARPEIEAEQEAGTGLHQKTNSEVVVDILKQLGYEEYQSAGVSATQGVLAGIVNGIGQAGSFLFGILNVINQFLFHDSVAAIFIILLGLLIRFIYWCFVGNVLVVGKNRFFMETVTYEHAPVPRMLFIYRVNRAFKVAAAMFMRGFFLLLWMLTIVGGPIKYYTYYMIPYIVAENPDIDWKSAMALSKRMTSGHKWRMFLLDLSFIGWDILNAFTFGLLDLFYIVPYKNSVRAQLYQRQREQVIREKCPCWEMLDDRYLFEEPAVIPEEIPSEKIDPELRMLEYPVQLFKIPEEKRREWMEAHYDRPYSLRSIILLFFTFSIVGWLWEVGLHMVQAGEFVNRGTMFGPWLPIYGSGGCLVILLLRRYAKHPLVTFGLTVLLCGVVEYGTGWYLEVTKGVKWWDYTGYFLNLHGRICAEGLLVFGIGGCAAIYVIGPALDEKFKKIPKKVQTALCVILIALFCSDIVYSHFHPNTGNGITQPAAEKEMQSAAAGATIAGSAGGGLMIPGVRVDFGEVSGPEKTELQVWG
ncbi:DUF975 family protein [Cuneatibacter caecimuris]|nr:DUF975 family protein [Cuneatibacter caecimuris]